MAGDYLGEYVDDDTMPRTPPQKGTGRASDNNGDAKPQVNLHKLLIKKAKNNREYKKYHEIAGTLILNYYKRLGNIDQATDLVYSLVDGADTVEGLLTHYNALMAEEKKENGERSTGHAKSKIANTLLNDYRRRFGQKKSEAYNVLVLQSWVPKVENINELAILMDNILTVRDKIGNSWDYEIHIIPMLLEKAFTTETLVDYANSSTNLIIGLSRRLKDNYLAVMTAVKILEYADSPKVIKQYLRDMVKDANKKIDQLNAEHAMLQTTKVAQMVNVMRVRELRAQIDALNRQVEDIMNGIDPKELMLDGAKR